MGTSIGSPTRAATRRIAVAVLVAQLVLLPGARPARAVAFSVTPEENVGLAVAIGSLVGAVDAGVILGLVPFYPVSVFGESTELQANLALKLTPPVFEPPPDREYHPRGCTFEISVPRSEDRYEEWFGFWELDPLATDWGDLGSPSVRHANSEVVVSVRGPGIFDDPGRPVNVFLPEGVHEYDWLARTQFSLLFDSILPSALLALGIGVEARYARAVAARAARVGAKQARRLRREVIQHLLQLALDLDVRALDAEGSIDEILATTPTAENVATQTITVYDTHTPRIRQLRRGGSIEAADLGGIRFIRAEEELLDRFEAFDECGRPITLANDAPPILPLGTTVIRWTASDGGFYAPGVSPTASFDQTVVVEDTQPPLLMAPDGQVHELAPGRTSLPLADVDLGIPQVVDLVDPEPEIAREGPSEVPVDTRLPVRWSATDGSGNRAAALQWLTAKRAGTNTAPSAVPTQGATETSVPIDLRLEGIDPDSLPTQLPAASGETPETVDMVDALGFEIVDRPDHGEFVAPLRPVFIEDFRLTPVGETEQDGVRTSPLGPLAAEFQAVPPGEQVFWVRDRGCPHFGTDFPVDMVYQPSYVHVTDEGEYYVRDHYWACNRAGGGWEPERVDRISRWSEEREFLGHARLHDAYPDDGTAPGFHREIFTFDPDGGIWWLADELSFGGSVFSLHRVSHDLEDFAEPLAFGVPEQEAIQGRRMQHAHAHGDLVYVHDRRGVFVVHRQGRELGRLAVDGEADFLPNYHAVFPAPAAECAPRPMAGAIDDWMATDSTGALYVSEPCGNRIHKFEPSVLAPNGEFEPGAHVGWMGRCSANVPPYSGCDEDRGASKGFACTDATCLREGGTAGDAPGQFSWPGHLNIDPDDQLYVADAGNLRVQRFGPDGTFAGEARSEGAGVSQGDGFVLGNMGPPAAVSVNASSLFVMEATPRFGDFFLHVFEGLPFRPIPAAPGSPADVDRDGYEDNAVEVRYVPRFDFPSALGRPSAVDEFTYRVSDGLAASEPASVRVTVERSFRPPEKLTIRCYEPGGGDGVPCVVDEDEAIDVELESRDPDGVIGFGGLDTLAYEILEGPPEGQLQPVSSNAGLARYRFLPDPDVNGVQELRYRVSDGVFEVESEPLPITVEPVDDDPVFTLLQAEATRGFGAQIMIEIRDVDADLDEGLPDELFFRWGGREVAPGELRELPDGQFEITGPLVNRIDAGRYMVQASPVFTRAGSVPLGVRWSYEADGYHDGEERIVSLGEVEVEPSSQLGVAVQAGRHDPEAGSRAELEVVVTNARPEGWSGYTAQDVDVEIQLPPGMGSLAFGSPCTPQGRTVRCAIGDLAPGGEWRLPLRPLLDPEGYSASETVRAVVRARDPGGVRRREAEVMLFPRWTDSDGDGLPDAWEQAFGLRVGVDDGALDPDGDGLDNAEELGQGTIPVEADSDGDGLDDRAEVEDHGTDPTRLDSDSDGLLDGFELAHGLDPNRDDAHEDADGDGLTHLAEQEGGTDPRRADSDGDGVDDGLERVAEGSRRAVTGGTTSLSFAGEELGATGLLLESTSAEVASPGGLGEGSYDLPINPRGETEVGPATTFLYAPEEFPAGVGGAIGHAGVLNLRDELGRSRRLGDFALLHDPARQGDGRSGFFLESTTGTPGPAFDLAGSGRATMTDRSLVIESRLLVADELAALAGRHGEAGADVGQLRVQAVSEPAARALGALALAILAALRARRWLRGRS